MLNPLPKVLNWRAWQTARVGLVYSTVMIFGLTLSCWGVIGIYHYFSLFICKLKKHIRSDYKTHNLKKSLAAALVCIVTRQWCNTRPCLRGQKIFLIFNVDKLITASGTWPSPSIHSSLSTLYNLASQSHSTITYTASGCRQWVTKHPGQLTVCMLHLSL